VWFLSLHLFMFCLTFMDLCMLNHPCILGVKQTWSWYMNFLICFEFCWPVVFENLCNYTH
jgi:hypothetical protein